MIWIIGVLTLVIIGWYSMGLKGQGKQAKVFYNVVKIEKGNISRSVTASGSVSAVITVDVGSQLSGQIKEIYADFNSKVKEGQLIAELDPSIFEITVKQREASVEISQANLEAQTASLASEKASFDQAGRDLSRQKELFGNGNSSEFQLEEAQARFDTSNYKVIMGEAQLRNARAVIVENKGQLQRAKIDLERTQIRSPIDGVVIERSVDKGQTVAASFSAPTMFLIAQDLKDIRIEAAVDESDIGQVKEGNPVSFKVDAYPERSFRGQIDEVRLSPTILQNVVTYTVVIGARNESLLLLPGMTATVEIITGSREGVLRVKSEALRFVPRQVSETSRGQSVGSGAIGADGMVERLAKALEMNPDQKVKAQEELGKIFAEFRGGGSPQGGQTDPRGRREAFAAVQVKIKTKLTEILSPAQVIKLDSVLGGRPGGSQGGTIWIQDESVELKPHRVVIGISDGQYTEISTRTLKEGDVVISGRKRMPSPNGGR